MTDIKMLPLPETLRRSGFKSSVEAYASAVAEHNVKALRAEREVIAAEAVKYADKSGRLEAKVERLTEALRDARDYVTTALREERGKFSGHEDCSDIPGIEADLNKIDAALRDHDQEGKDG